MPDVILVRALLLLCCWSVIRLAAATSSGYAVRTWETDDGLPQNSILAMAQTRDGYLWLGTANGLARFDGMQFTIFEGENLPGLASGPIVHLFEDSRGDLWIGTQNSGTVVLRDGKLIAPPQLAAGGAERRLIAACEDNQGAVWLYHWNGDIWRSAHGQFTLYVLWPVQASPPQSIISEDSGLVWLGTAQRHCAVNVANLGASAPTTLMEELPISIEIPGVRSLDRLIASAAGGYWRMANGLVQKWRQEQLLQTVATYPWPPHEVTAACEDSEGNLLVGTRSSGLFQVSTNGTVTALATNNTALQTAILSLLVDREGNLWVGTESGLNRVRKQWFDLVDATRGWAIRSVAATRDGIWFTSSGNDVGYLGTNGFQRYGFAEGVLSPHPTAVLVDREDRVWVGDPPIGLLRFEAGLFQRVRSAGVSSFIRVLHEDRQGRLWLGTENGLAGRAEEQWEIYSVRHGLSADAVSALADDAEGNLWIGTQGGGLNRLQRGDLSAWRKADGFPSDEVSSLYVDDDGTLWIGTFNSGLVRMRDGRWNTYRKAEGLISDRVTCVIEDELGGLWIGSNAGLMRAPKKELIDVAEGRSRVVPFRTYGKTDGMPTAECSSGAQPSASRAPDGRLWFATTKGLISVNPKELRANTNPPPVVIDSVLLDGETPALSSVLARPQSITVPAASEGRIEVRYASLNLGAPERARFRYRLRGHESEWSEAGNSRVARYSRLPPGEYQFQVTASNEDGIWNETGSTLAIIVQPPFWRTWWFIAGSVLAVLGLTAGVVHFISTQRLQRQLALLRQQEAVERERARIARDIHDQVGASLTQVALLGELVQSDKDSPPDIEDHARQISQTARETTRALDEIVWTVNPSNDTLEGLINYICKYAQDYLSVAGVRYRLDIPPALPAAAISPEMRHNVFLAAKEAVTNIVRHARASEAWIRLRLAPSSFTLEIEDNGRGLGELDPKKADLRHGLKNMRKRLEEVGGTFALESAQSGGAVVRLTAPFTAQAPGTNG